MEETTNKSGMSTGMVVGIAVIVAIVFGSGAYAITNSKSAKEKKDLNAQITELRSQDLSTTTATAVTPSASTSAAAAGVSGQNLYKNEKIGFSFQMPAGYIVSEDYTSEYASPVQVSLRISKTAGLNINEYSNVEMFVGNEPSSYTGNDSVDKMVSSWKLQDVTSSKDVKISGTNAKVVETAGMLGSTAHYFALGNDQYLRFDQLKDSKTDNQGLVDKIVSTFQFAK